MEEPKKKMGRPPIPDDERLVQRSLRAKKRTWARVDMYGQEWARNAIDNAPSPEDLEKAAAKVKSRRRKPAEES